MALWYKIWIGPHHAFSKWLFCLAFMAILNYISNKHKLKKIDIFDTIFIFFLFCFINYLTIRKHCFPNKKLNCFSFFSQIWAENNLRHSQHSIPGRYDQLLIYKYFHNLPEIVKTDARQASVAEIILCLVYLSKNSWNLNNKWGRQIYKPNLRWPNYFFDNNP